MAGYHAIGQPTFPPHMFTQSDLVGVSYPLRNTWALNDTNVPSVQVSDPFQYGQIPTLTNVNDHYLNIYGPWQPTPVLPSCYALEEAGLLASSTGVDQSGNTVYEVGNAVPQSGNNIYDVGNAVSQSGNTIYDVGNAAPQSGNTIYGVGNAVPQSYMPLLSQSTFLGLPIDATAEVSIAPPHPTSVSEILHDSSLDLHGPIQHTEPNTCRGCRQSFPSTAELERHAKSLYHDAFECKCGKHYARLDNLKRHWNQTPRFPCPHCDKYTGINAFAREDHLTQHLQTYHRHRTSIGNQGDTNTLTSTTTMQFFCIFPNCTHHQRSFKIKSQYTDHMRRIHNYSPFPCLVQGCVKIGGKGYFRERDLFKHSQEVHSV